jgi:hypothetical protein
MAVNPAGEVALVGEYQSPTDFGPFALVMHSGFSAHYAYYMPNANNEDYFSSCRFSQADGTLWACGTLNDNPYFEGGLMVFLPNGLNRELYRFSAPASKTYLRALDFAPGGGVLVAADLYAPVTIDLTQRDSQPLAYTLAVPVQDAQTDNSGAQLGLYPAGTPTGKTDQPTGGTLYKFYQPLE